VSVVSGRDVHDRDARYRALYEENFRLVLGYALRRTESSDDAADVAAECMLIAWRRLSEVPAGTEARLWLYGVARRVLANHRRGAERRDRLGLRLREQLRQHLPTDPAEAATADGAVHAALHQLPPADRELISLIAWEGLEPREAARVLGVSSATARTRLHRARRRLRELLGDAVTVAGHVIGDGQGLVPEEQL
jgi:RNA polymerase sigma-70 factor (ECF subfamily)